MSVWTSEPIPEGTQYKEPDYIGQGERAMAQHIEPTPPTQVVHPWRATVRTVAAYAVAALVAGAVGLPLVVEALGVYLPANVRVALIWLAGFCAALVGLVTRLMAVPAVNDFLARIGLGASK